MNNARRMTIVARLVVGLALPLAAGACAEMPKFDISKLDLSAIGGDTPKVRALRAKAEDGDAQSSYRMGMRYHVGRDLKQDYAEANEWFALAANQGHVRAMYMYGTSLYVGRGVPRDFGKGVNWLRKAALKGHSRAQYHLAEAYRTGKGGVADLAWSARWLGRSAQQGYNRAQFLLGGAYAAGIGLPENNIESLKWLKLAEEAGHKRAADLGKKIAAKMTAADIARAGTLAAAWTKPEKTPANGEDYGDGPTIRYVQQALNGLGFSAGSVDGVMGNRTRDAIVHFQKSAGLAASGEITPDLVGRLRTHSREKPAT